MMKSFVLWSCLEIGCVPILQSVLCPAARSHHELDKHLRLCRVGEVVNDLFSSPHVPFFGLKKSVWGEKKGPPLIYGVMYGAESNFFSSQR